MSVLAADCSWNSASRQRDGLTTVPERLLIKVRQFYCRLSDELPRGHLVALLCVDILRHDAHHEHFEDKCGNAHPRVIFSVSTKTSILDGHENLNFLHNVKTKGAVVKLAPKWPYKKTFPAKRAR